MAQVVTLLQSQRQGWHTAGVASGWAWPGVRLLEAGQPVFAAHPLRAAHTARFPSRSSNSPPLCAQNQIINTPSKELCFVPYYSCCQEVLAAWDPHRLSLHAGGPPLICGTHYHGGPPPSHVSLPVRVQACPLQCNPLQCCPLQCSPLQCSPLQGLSSLMWGQLSCCVDP